MQVLRILGGIICLFATATMGLGYFQQLIEPTVNPNIVNHPWGMFFLGMAFLGCAGTYGAMGFWLFSMKRKLEPVAFPLIAMFTMMIGLWALIFIA